ncbi:MAG TPA: T9SS type A sorting domain-containing protein [Panacibacter sp.]|nr:T9SS type A sorting domain-containing protein [Panacibacter sp.]HNP45355.1 T9SS type A sorting domain-containing protein [Panacibacter sp.]
MKKLLLLALCAAVTLAGFATRFTIKVQDFQFKAKTVNAKVGDTVVFKWVNGIHTTTSITIPVGATTWNKPMDSAHKSFTYILKVAGVYNYNCTYHAPLMKGTINVSAALASGVSGISVNDDYGKALLNWNTKSTNGLSYFSVQKSTDGENFTEISRINPGAGTHYRFIDNEKASSKYIYYQVKAVDNNGNSELSEITMFTAKSVAEKLITSISPNPVTSPGHLMLQFNANADGIMLVQVYNSKGILVKQAEMSASKGLNNGHLHLGDLTAGTYYVNCTLGNLYEKHTIIYR